MVLQKLSLQDFSKDIKENGDLSNKDKALQIYPSRGERKSKRDQILTQKQNKDRKGEK